MIDGGEQSKCIFPGIGMTDFIKVTTIDSVPVNSVKTFEVNSLRIAVANLGGEFYAIDDLCTHDGGTLGEGEVVGDCCVECPRHGARFELKTGEVKSLPATVPIKTYEVKVEGGWVLVGV